MKNQPAFNLVFCTLLVLASLSKHGNGAECGAKNTPTVKQTQVGFGDPPKYAVEVQNACPMCPVINIHVKCGGFSQSLVNPKLLQVLGHGDCVVNGGFPLSPLQKITFSYSHKKIVLSPSTWSFQCE